MRQTKGGGPVPDRITFPVDDGSGVETLLRFKLRPGPPLVQLRSGDLRMYSTGLDRLQLKGEIPGLAPYYENAAGTWAFRVIGPAGSGLDYSIPLPAKCSTKPSCHASVRLGATGGKVSFALSYSTSKQLWSFKLSGKDQIPRNDATGSEQLAVSICPPWFDPVAQAGECATGQFPFTFSAGSSGSRLRYP